MQTSVTTPKERVTKLKPDLVQQAVDGVQMDQVHLTVTRSLADLVHGTSEKRRVDLVQVDPSLGGLDQVQNPG